MKLHELQKKLRADLADARQQSLIASRACDFRKVGKLTVEIALLNKTLAEVDGQLEGIGSLRRPLK